MIYLQNINKQLINKAIIMNLGKFGSNFNKFRFHINPLCTLLIFKIKIKIYFKFKNLHPN